MCIKELNKYASGLQKYVSKNIILKSLSAIGGFILILFSLSNITLFILKDFSGFSLFWILLIIGYILLIISDKKFENVFVIFSIFAAILIFSGILFFINQSDYDMTKFPFYPKFRSNDISIEDAKCGSMLLHRDVPTENDVFYCMMHIENRNVNTSFIIEKVNIIDYYIPFQIETSNRTYCYSFTNLDYDSSLPSNSSKECLLRFIVGNAGSHEKTIEFAFTSSQNISDKRNVFSEPYSLRYNSLSDSQYNEIKNNTLTLFFSGIIATFSSVYFVRNFMEIWDRKTKSKKKEMPKMRKDE